MDSLAHWDYSLHFSGHEAAALIVGIEPRRTELTLTEESSINVVLERLKLHYTNALKRHYFKEYGVAEEEIEDLEKSRSCELESIALQSMLKVLKYKDPDTSPDQDRFLYWVHNQQSSSFAAQFFSRETISNWLTATALQSKYRFVIDQSCPNEQTSIQWPWGAHHTELLGHLSAAARKYWANYDPDDPTTAATNNTVAAWLKSERRVSEKMAEAIASILRADGLPTGPRKNGFPP